MYAYLLLLTCTNPADKRVENTGRYWTRLGRANWTPWQYVQRAEQEPNIDRIEHKFITERASKMFRAMRRRAENRREEILNDETLTWKDKKRALRQLSKTYHITAKSPSTHFPAP